MRFFKHETPKPFTALFYNCTSAPAVLNISDGRRFVYEKENDQSNISCLKVNFFHGGAFYTNFDFAQFQIMPLETIALPTLPPFERNREQVPRVIHNESITDTPARIYSEIGVIETGKAFKTMPLPFKMFVLYHEYGHFFYNTEQYADAFAFYHFIKNGGNPSAAVSCLVSMLKTKNASPEQIAQNMNRIYTLFNIAK